MKKKSKRTILLTNSDRFKNKHTREQVRILIILLAQVMSMIWVMAAKTITIIIKVKFLNL